MNVPLLRSHPHASVSAPEHIYKAIAKSLGDFGYEHVTGAEIKEVHDAMKTGIKPLPHGIVGMFAEGQINDVTEQLGREW